MSRHISNTPVSINSLCSMYSLYLIGVNKTELVRARHEQILQHRWQITQIAEENRQNVFERSLFLTLRVNVCAVADLEHAQAAYC